MWRERRPREPEEAGGDEPAQHEEMREPSFRDRSTTTPTTTAQPRNEVSVEAVDKRGGGRREGHADANAEEGEAGGAGGPVAGGGEDERVGGEVNEEDAEDEGHVEGEGEDDGLGEEHDERAAQAGGVEVVQGAVHRGEAGAAAFGLEELGGVGFGEEEEHAEEEEAADDGDHPVVPMLYERGCFELSEEVSCDLPSPCSVLHD